MPEYLSPGVYIEEVSFRSRTIEGVSTSTAGFVGPARFGPVSGEPELVTSLADFQRIYGDLEDLTLTSGEETVTQVNYLAHSVRAFFEEGGRRLFVQRVFNAGEDGFGLGDDGVPATFYATATVPLDSVDAAVEHNLVARFPGVAGNMRITFDMRVGRNVYLAVEGASDVLTRLENNALVLIAPVEEADDGLRVARLNPDNNAWQLLDSAGAVAVDLALDAAAEVQPAADFVVHPLSVIVEVARPTAVPDVFDEPETLGEFSFAPEASNYLLDTFVANPENRFDALSIPFALITGSDAPSAIELAVSLMGGDLLGDLLTEDAPTLVAYRLGGGNDGNLPIPATYEGDVGFNDLSDDILQMPLNGLRAFESVEDISIVAAPGYTADRNQDNQLGIQNAVINHCERMRYRVAVLDVPENQTVTSALDFRNLRSSNYAAIYYPWVIVSDPRPSQGGRRLKLPPSGFMAGIYARNDVENAVFKAPANEVVRLAIDFEVKLNQAQQDLLNPNGVSCLRFFEGRGFLVWGGRTISDDPEWKYISLRRYFAYLERSIDRATQWTVFENNGPDLWGKLRRSVEDFLYNEWVAGGLLGNKPEQSYFVRCDRTTMTQNDLDNGRLVCLIGVAPVKPAEFVIFRIGQWTADATN